MSRDEGQLGAADGAAAGRSVRVEFGRRWITPEAAAALKPGSIVELDAEADRWVDVYADGRLLACGTAMALDGKLCVRLERMA